MVHEVKINGMIVAALSKRSKDDDDSSEKDKKNKEVMCTVI